MSASDEPFLARWSRLKRKPANPGSATNEGNHRGSEPDGAGPAQAATTASSHPSSHVEPERRDPAEATVGDAGKELVEELAAIDVETLDFQSDFSRFMEKGVPDHLRTRALRKLWTTDPVFGVLDGLDDYCEDFSDAVWATGELKTAYKVGQGFLTDEEVAAWEALDKPERPEGGDDTAQPNGDGGVGLRPDSHAPAADPEGGDEQVEAASPTAMPASDVATADPRAGAVAALLSSGTTPYVPSTGVEPDRAALGPFRSDCPAVVSDADWRKVGAYMAGVELFDAAYFWEAHEVWEPVWMAASPNSRERSLVAGLIQLANACLKIEMGRHRAAARIADAAVELLVEARMGSSRLMGLDVAGLVQACEGYREMLHRPTAPSREELAGARPRLGPLL